MLPVKPDYVMDYGRLSSPVNVIIFNTGVVLCLCKNKNNQQKNVKLSHNSTNNYGIKFSITDKKMLMQFSRREFRVEFLIINYDSQVYYL